MKTLVLWVLEESMEAIGSCVLILEKQVVALSVHGTHHARRMRVTCPHSPALLGAGFPRLGAQHTTQQLALSLLFG